MVRADLIARAAELLRPEWLAARRWSGARDRVALEAELVDAISLPLPEGVPVTEAWLLVAEVRFADGDARRYLLPVVGDGAGPLREPADGDGAWRALVLALGDGAVLRGEHGSIRSEVLPAFASLVPDERSALAGLAERQLGVEQSNTSVMLGGGLILKVYRRLEPGESPEIEVGTFLESVGCPVAPRMAAAGRYLAAGDATAAAAFMLQERIAADGDAWSGLLGQLSGADGGPDAALTDVRRLGATTAQLHASLASRPQDPAFPVRSATPAETEAMLNGALAQLDGALRVLAGAERQRLDAVAPRIREELESALRFRAARVTRIHGDYHLGQVLRAHDRFVVIDFEGEPARPLEARRLPQPPERDVSGMLRSLDYAAHTAERAAGAPGFEAAGWLPVARAAFLDGYGEAAPSVPDPSLLRAFELEKACYEVRYEAANRPDWLWLPLDALSRLA